MTNEMIERCARAVHEALSRANVMAYLDMPEDTASIAARAVLQTLMTPTDEMVEAGERAAWDHDNHMPAPRAMKAGWTAMLTEALEERP